MKFLPELVSGRGTARRSRGVEGPQRSEDCNAGHATDIDGSAPLRRPSTVLRTVPLPQTSWGRRLNATHSVMPNSFRHVGWSGRCASA